MAAVLIGPLALLGCEEAGLLLLTPPGLIVGLPLGGAVILAEGPEIRQPVLVQSASGEALTPPFVGRASAKFTVDEATVVCTGKHKLNRLTVVADPNAEGGYSTYYKIPLSCNKGLKGRAFVTMLFPKNTKSPYISVEIGPKHVPLKKAGSDFVLGETRFSCLNQYSVQSAPVAPFRVKCSEQRNGEFFKYYAAVAQQAVNQSDDEFTLWIFPSN